MMRVLSRLLLAVFTAMTVILLHQWSINAQTPQLYYTYRDRQIPLVLRQDIIAAKRKNSTTRGGEPPFYQQLQSRLNPTVRGGTPSINIQPLREDYALLQVSQTRSNQVRQQLNQQQDLIESLPPVLSRPSTNEVIVLPNEIVVNFELTLSDSKIQQLLQQQNLEIIRPISQRRRFYLVRSRNATGIAALNAANQLSKVTGVKSAMPNFIQADSAKAELPAKSQRSVSNLSTLIDSVPNLKALQWHLNSTSLIQCLQQRPIDGTCWQQKQQRGKPPRYDLHATESWQNSRQGEGVTVAVIDTLIQWDHPDLQANLYTASKRDRCVGEHGWDFVSDRPPTHQGCVGDDDTRMSSTELNLLSPLLKASFLSDSDLLKALSDDVRDRKKSDCQTVKGLACSDAQLADWVRDELRSLVEGSFHGTAVAGVLTARSPNGEGLLGVAPKAKLLPIRAGGIGQAGFTTDAIIQAVEYAETQQVDVINMSFGSDLPNAPMETAIASVLSDNPKLVIVVAAGNENRTQMGSPANVTDVVTVGATNLSGHRAQYSNYGQGLDVVAPGGEFSADLFGGVATAGGTFKPEFWRGMAIPKERWGQTIDVTGQYIWTQGTSFASPAIAGVVALMKGEDVDRRLTREQLVGLLKQSASSDGLAVSLQEKQTYDSQLSSLKTPTVEQFVFGSGLVNAETAVRSVQHALK